MITLVPILQLSQAIFSLVLNELKEILDDGKMIFLPLELKVSSLPGLRGNCFTVAEGGVIPHPLLLMIVGFVGVFVSSLLSSLLSSLAITDPLIVLPSVFRPMSVPPRLFDGSIAIIHVSDQPLIAVHSTFTAKPSS